MVKYRKQIIPTILIIVIIIIIIIITIMEDFSRITLQYKVLLSTRSFYYKLIKTNLIKKCTKMKRVNKYYITKSKLSVNNVTGMQIIQLVSTSPAPNEGVV